MNTIKINGGIGILCSLPIPQHQATVLYCLVSGILLRNSWVGCGNYSMTSRTKKSLTLFPLKKMKLKFGGNIGWIRSLRPWDISPLQNPHQHGKEQIGGINSKRS